MLAIAGWLPGITKRLKNITNTSKHYEQSII